MDPYVIYYGFGDKLSTIDEAYRWAVENAKGKVKIQISEMLNGMTQELRIIYELEEDATMFTLRWL